MHDEGIDWQIPNILILIPTKYSRTQAYGSKASKIRLEVGAAAYVIYFSRNRHIIEKRDSSVHSASDA